MAATEADLAETLILLFLVNLAFYIGVNALLIEMNAAEGGYPWAVFPVFFWGIGVIMHYYGCFFKYVEEHLKDWKGIELFRKIRNWHLIHLTVYVTVMTFLVFINLRSPEYLWVIYPLVFWGAGLVAHFAAHFKALVRERK